jgi:regulatory protein
MKEIVDEDYRETLRRLLEKKNNLINETDSFVRKDKLSKYAISRGYEPDLVWRLIKEIF